MLQALFNIFVVMALYTLSRLFFYLTNLDLYADVSAGHLFEMLGGGVRFDLVAVLYLSSLYLLLACLPLPRKVRMNRVYAGIQKYCFLVPNWIGLLVNSADMVYFNFTNRRTTCSFFTEFQNEGNLFTIFIEAVVQYWYVSLFAIAVCVGLFFAYRPWKSGRFFNPFRKSGRKSGRFFDPEIKEPSQFPQKEWVYYVVTTVFFLAGMYFTVIGMRGGFGSYTRPIGMNDALLYVERPAESALVLNTPFCLMKSLGSTTYQNPQYYSDEELESIMTPIHDGNRDGSFEGNRDGSLIRKSKNRPNFQKRPNFQTPNVVILILESFGAEHIGFYNPASKAYTPFLDSLLGQSIVFRNAYSCGRKSIDVCPAVLSSIPMLYEPYVVSSYSTNEVSSVADVLGKRGYSTSFFHGAPNGSMGFSAYAKNIKFQSYYGMDEYMADPQTDHDAFDGTWAIWDEEFLAYYARTLGKMREPFLSAIFTASSHHPFAVPERYKGKLPEGPSPLCKCIAYSDHALRGFFESASRQKWFKNTVFVIVADHTNEPILPEYLTDEGLFRIPIAFYIPSGNRDGSLIRSGNRGNRDGNWDGSLIRKSKNRPNFPNFPIEPRVDSTTVMSQVDIFPSIMALLGYDEPFFAFGQNALTEPKAHNYAVMYMESFFQIVSVHGVIQFDGSKVVSVKGEIPAEEQEDMVRYLKGYIQQYVARLTENRMTCR